MLQEMEMEIEFNGYNFDVEFDYEKGDRMVRYYADGSGYPGSPDMIEITSVKYKGEDFTQFFNESILNWKDRIEELIWEKLES